MLPLLTELLTLPPPLRLLTLLLRLLTLPLLRLLALLLQLKKQLLLFAAAVIADTYQQPLLMNTDTSTTSTPGMAEPCGKVPSRVPSPLPSGAPFRPRVPAGTTSTVGSQRHHQSRSGHHCSRSCHPPPQRSLSYPLCGREKNKVKKAMVSQYGGRDTAMGGLLRRWER